MVPITIGIPEWRNIMIPEGGREGGKNVGISIGDFLM
jgi:hypothetical protein